MDMQIATCAAPVYSAHGQVPQWIHIDMRDCYRVPSFGTAPFRNQYAALLKTKVRNLRRCGRGSP